MNEFIYRFTENERDLKSAFEVSLPGLFIGKDVGHILSLVEIGDGLLLTAS